MWHLIWSYVFLAFGLFCLALAGRVTWDHRIALKKWLGSLVDWI